jgi:hypothetical protein
MVRSVWCVSRETGEEVFAGIQGSRKGRLRALLRGGALIGEC